MSQSVYIVGIEGAGTSALAQIYKKRGFKVSGSDEGDGFYREALNQLGIDVYTNFAAHNLPQDVDFVIHSTAYNSEHIEIVEAVRRGVEVLSYPEAIGRLTTEMKTIAVCGTHGKTTTTGMTASAMEAVGVDPTALVGAPMASWGGQGSRTGEGEYFVLEADEYQNKLAMYQPYGVIVTSIDYDHPDFFSTEEMYQQTFRDFLGRVHVNGFVIAYAGDDDVLRAIKGLPVRVMTYGRATDDANVRIVKRWIDDHGKHVITFLHPRAGEQEVSIDYIGEHNALNALAAWCAAYEVADERPAEHIRRGLSAYRGVSRRMEFKGSRDGVDYYDDYAHHPTELQATLAALREKYAHGRVIALFHPHTYSRTEALLDEFAASFVSADVIGIVDIYASAREADGTITSQDLVDKIKEVNQKVSAQAVGDVEEALVWVKSQEVAPGDVVVTLGAGDVYKIHSEL